MHHHDSFLLPSGRKKEKNRKWAPSMYDGSTTAAAFAKTHKKMHL